MQDIKHDHICSCKLLFIGHKNVGVAAVVEQAREQGEDEWSGGLMWHEYELWSLNL